MGESGRYQESINLPFNTFSPELRFRAFSVVDRLGQELWFTDRGLRWKSYRLCTETLLLLFTNYDAYAACNLCAYRNLNLCYVYANYNLYIFNYYAACNLDDNYSMDVMGISLVC